MSQFVSSEPQLIRIGALAGTTIDDIVTESDAECCAGIEITNKHQFIELTCVGHYIASGKISRFPLPNAPPNTINAVLFESTEHGQECSGMIVFEINRLVLTQTGAIERVNVGVKLALAWITFGHEYDNEIALCLDKDIQSNHQSFESVMYGGGQYWRKNQNASDPPIFLKYSAKNLLFRAKAIISTGNKSMIFLDFS